MPAPAPSTRRLAIAIGTAAASATLAVGVTAASMLGWFDPTASSSPDLAPQISTPTPDSSPVILVPVEPTAPRPVTAAAVADLTRTTTTTVENMAAITTTTRKPMTTEAHHRSSPLELRLYVVALLAAVYTISWRAIGSTEPTVLTTSRTREPQRFVWIDNVPPDKRPVIVLPAGWQRTSEAPAVSTQPAPPSRREPRVRTRSS